MTTEQQTAIAEAASSATDAAYNERNRCVALIASFAISKGWKAGLAKTDIEGWDPEWHNCVYIDLPTGQASWHFHDRELSLFSHLPAYEGEWDGHSTEQKYDRIEVMAMALCK